jgi:hypothetical protein
MPPVPPRKSWRILAVLAVALGILALRCGWPYYRTYQFKQIVEQAGGMVAMLPAGPEWTRPYLGNKLRLALGTPVVFDTRSAVIPFGLVEQFPTIRTLIFRVPSLTDSDLASLGELRRLEFVDLTGTAITGPGLVHLQEARGLRTLTLSESAVTDRGLASVSCLTQLESLDLDGTAVTDAGLRELQTLTNLRELSLSNTRVTELAVTELRKRLPDLAVSDD